MTDNAKPGSLKEYAIIYGVAVVFFLLVGLLINEPGDVADAHFYFNSARLLAEGEGLNAPYFWNWVNPPESLPAPSFRYWQPLASFMGAAGIWLFGWAMPPFKAAQTMIILFAGFIPLISYGFARQLSDEPWEWRLAAGLTIVGGFYVTNFPLTETFTAYALAGGGALLATGVALRSGKGWHWLLAGAACGFAHLARVDGPLLLGVVGLIAGLPLGPRDGPVRLGAIFSLEAWRTNFWRRIGAGLLVLGGYLLVMTPWFVRNAVTFGSVMAPGGSATIWIVNYEELFEYPTNISFQRFVEAGLWPNLENRLRSSWRNLSVFLVVVGQIFLAPLMLRGLWKWRDDRAVFPTLFYLVLLYMVMSWLFALQGMRGSWPHSVTATLPPLLGMAAAQSRDLARLMVRWRGGRLRDAHQFVMVGLMLIAVIATGFLLGRDAIGVNDLSRLAWNEPGDQMRAIDAELDGMGIPEDGTIMSQNPLGLYTHTGRPNIPNPVNADSIVLLSERYDVQAVVLSDGLFDEIEGLREGVEAEPRLELVTQVPVGEEMFVYIYTIRPRD